MCALISYLDILAASNLLSQVGPPWALIIGRRKGVAWRRKGRTAEVWIGNERAEIFEYFGKLEKSMVCWGLKPLHKAHKSEMSKVRKFWPGPGRAVWLSVESDLPGWPVGCSSWVGGKLGCASLFCGGSCPEQPYQILCICDCLPSTTGRANLVVF